MEENPIENIMNRHLIAAHAAMSRAIELTRGIGKGDVQSPLVLFDVYRDLVEAYSGVSSELSTRFSAKEQSYLRRKIAEAKQYRANRYDAKLTSKDAEMQSKLECGEEYEKEIDAAALYEQYNGLLRSIDRAIDYIRSISSFAQKEERRYTLSSQ